MQTKVRNVRYLFPWLSLAWFTEVKSFFAVPPQRMYVLSQNQLNELQSRFVYVQTLIWHRYTYFKLLSVDLKLSNVLATKWGPPLPTKGSLYLLHSSLKEHISSQLMCTVYILNTRSDTLLSVHHKLKLTQQKEMRKVQSDVRLYLK